MKIRDLPTNGFRELIIRLRSDAGANLALGLRGA